MVAEFGCFWSKTVSFSGKFLLACSLLEVGEHYKAYDLFTKAAHGVQIDDFLRRRVVRTDAIQGRTLVLYYIQVLTFFILILQFWY